MLHRSTLTAVASFTFFFLFPFIVSDSAVNESQVRCSETCAAENCDTIAIKYGKFCGVGWSGCAGEKPCDDLDACCQIHDDCVGDDGLMDIKCHEDFKKCIQKVKETGKAGFSEICPYEKVMPTMIQGMDMAILFSQFGLPKDEL